MGGGIGGLPYITDSDGDLNVFNVDYDNDDRWLNTNYCNPENLFNPDSRVVFVLPRNYLNFSPLDAESFVFVDILTIRRSAYQFFLGGLIGLYTFYH